jgi:hypothetical protein
MSRIIPLILLFFVFNQKLISQVGIGTTNPHESAIVDVSSNNKGFLMPRMPHNQMQSINSPAEGLMVYCTNCCTNGSLTYFDGNTWKAIKTDCDNLIIPFIPDADDDFDGDGIPNDVDIDDDNDGIKDVDEFCGTNAQTFGQNQLGSSDNHTFTYQVNNAANLVIDIKNIDNAFELYINGKNIFEASTVTVNGTTALQRSMDIQGQDGTKQAFKVDMEFVNPNDKPYISGQNRVYSPWDARPDGQPRVRIVINEFGQVSAFATAHYSPSHPSYNNGLKPVQLRGYTSNGQMGNVVPFSQIELKPTVNDIVIVSTDESGVELFNGTFTSKEHCIDLDGDGLANEFDLDSDGDGCSDALEAGATTSTQTEYSFPTNNVGINGLDNSLEVIVDKGVINYPIINNYNNTTDASVSNCH